MFIILFLLPPQGIDSIPKVVPPNKMECGHELKGAVCSKSILGGTVKHYFYEDEA